MPSFGKPDKAGRNSGRRTGRDRHINRVFQKETPPKPIGSTGLISFQAHSGRLNTVALCRIISSTTGSGQEQAQC